MILIHNGEENRVYITVNKGSNEPIKVEFEEGPSHHATHTEVEVALPVDGFIEDTVGKLQQYYKSYKIGKSRTNFSFNLIMPPSTKKDNMTIVDGIEEEVVVRYARKIYSDHNTEVY